MSDFKVGDRVLYTSPFRTGDFPAVVVALHGSAGYVDIDVQIDTREPWRLKAINPSRLAHANQAGK
jgi:hypothetical protein